MPGWNNAAMASEADRVRLDKWLWAARFYKTRSVAGEAIDCGGRLLIFDAGTGLRPLGQDIDRGGTIDADIYFTHTHIDHIQGLPFFSSAYVPSNKFRLWAGHLLPDHTLRYVLSEMMMAPVFPIPITVLGADLSSHDFRAGETLSPGPGITVRTAPLNHPNGATGYLILGTVVLAITGGESLYVDLGHFVAGGNQGGTPLDFLNKFHGRISSVHLKDRTLPKNCGLNGRAVSVFGQISTGQKADLLMIPRLSKAFWMKNSTPTC